MKGGLHPNDCSHIDDRIDEQCDAFESACRNGRRPNIRDFIGTEDESYRNKLFQELLLVDMEWRRSLGEEPIPQDYLRAFPEFAAQIDGVNFLYGPAAHSNSADRDAVEAAGRKPDVLVSHFELIECLGAGAMGEVWKAWDTRVKRNVTLKFPHGHISSVNALRRFLREGEAAGQLSHPQLASIHSIENDGETYFIVATFVEGENLRDYASKKQLPYLEIIDICAGIGEVLQHAHNEGIVHRDLKPANIIIDPSGLPHVIDFGLAKLLDADHDLTMNGELLGTPAYMSPELASGDGDKASAPTDVYSLGVILYELLTGRCPYKGDRSAVIGQILASEPTPPRALRRGIPRDLETICLKAIQKSPEKRYATAHDMAEDLRRYAAGLPIRARRVGALEKCWRWTRRRPVTTAFAVIAVAAILATSTTIASLKNRNKRLAGFRSVYITTTPPGARLALVPLDPNTNEPVLDPARIVRPTGATPLTTELKAGPYLVEAVLPGDSEPLFVEVYRTVPDSSEVSASLARANEESGLPQDAFRFRNIEITPQRNLIEQMVSVVIPESLRAKHPSLPAKLYVNPKQTTPAELASHAKFKTLLNRTDDGAPCISYQSAITWAEFNQSRLPSSVEYDAIDAAAKHGEVRSVETGSVVSMDDLFDDFPEFSTTTISEPGIRGTRELSQLRGMHILKGFATANASSGVLPWVHGAWGAGAIPKSPKVSIRGVRSATPRFVKL